MAKTNHGGAYSRNKGKRGELLFCLLCKENGYTVQRTAQFCGKTGQAADVIGLPGLHVEVKRVERLNLHDAMDQAKRDAAAEGKGNLPIVAYRANRHPWAIIMPPETFFTLYREWEAGRALAAEDNTE